MNWDWFLPGMLAGLVGSVVGIISGEALRKQIGKPPLTGWKLWIDLPLAFAWGALVGLVMAWIN